MKPDRNTNLSNVNKNRERILSLLRSVDREGMDAFIASLDASDFFTAKGSYRHHNWKGGLAAHSLGVYDVARVLAPGENADSLIIAALLHDICKSHGRWPQEAGGHGYRSVKLAEGCGLKLSPQERRAIRWHMQPKRNVPDSDWQQARKERLRNAICMADSIDASSSWIVEHLQGCCSGR